MSVFPARRILVPVDLTAASGRAWKWAKALSAPDAVFETLYAFDLPPAPFQGLPKPPLPRAARARLAARLRKSYPGSAVRVDEADPASSILRRARRADLVVMASHGREGLSRALFGSVCESVVRGARAPVLSVRGAPRRIASVLAPVNPAPYSRRGLELAADAAAALGARLAVLYVASDRRKGPNPRFFLSRMLARLPAGLRAKTRPLLLTRVGDPVREILAESRRHGLVVLTAHRKALLTDFVLGTTAERVLRHARAPVLTAPSGL